MFVDESRGREEMGKEKQNPGTQMKRRVETGRAGKFGHPTTLTGVKVQLPAGADCRGFVDPGASVDRKREKEERAIQ